jgi:hypothetical protein
MEAIDAYIAKPESQHMAVLLKNMLDLIDSTVGGSGGKALKVALLSEAAQCVPDTEREGYAALLALVSDWTGITAQEMAAWQALMR